MRHSPTIRRRLGLLVILCAVPALLVAGALYWQNYNLQRQALSQQTLESARNIARLVDARFGAVEAVLQSLAVLPSLRNGKLDDFLVESSYTSPPEWLSALAVTDLSGRVLYDSSRRSEDWTPWDRKYYPSGLAVPKVSEPFFGGIALEPVVGVSVPVAVQGKHVFNLTGLVRVQEFTKLHLGTNAPESWLFSLVDEHGHIVSRSTYLPRHFRNLANPSLLDAMSESNEGFFDGTTAEGKPVFAVFSRAPKSRWAVAIGIPAKELGAQLQRTLIVSGTFFVLAIAIAVWAVWTVARNISSSVRELRAPALALGRGETPQLPRFYFREAEEVGDELLKAADLLHSAQYRANHDSLTGLPNRVLFGHLTEQQLAVAQRTGTPFSVLFVDLDGFKNVNDTLGHQAGDELLIQVAKRMQTHTRAADTISRHGGDEFAVLLFGTDAENAFNTAEGLLDAISFPYRVNGNSCTVSASIGVATYPVDGKTIESLLQSADQAMYAAKAQGKRRVVPYRALQLQSDRQRSAKA